MGEGFPKLDDGAAIKNALGASGHLGYITVAKQLGITPRVLPLMVKSF